MHQEWSVVYGYSPCSYVVIYVHIKHYLCTENSRSFPNLNSLIADSNEQGKEDLTTPSFICLVGRQSVDEGGRGQTKEEGSDKGGRGQTKEGSEEGGRGQTKEGGVRMILTSLLVVQELEF